VDYSFNCSFGIKEAGYAKHQNERGHSYKKIAKHTEFIEHFNFENGQPRAQKYDTGPEVGEGSSLVGQLGSL